MYAWILFLHIVGATIWTGGHLVLALTILPRALRDRSLTELQSFESNFERIGIPALLVQIASGVWLALQVEPDVARWFAAEGRNASLILLKLGLLLTTLLLAVDARLRVIPRLDESRLGSLAWHIIPVTVISVLYVLVGVAIRTGSIV
jgi:putative copper export protein